MISESILKESIYDARYFNETHNLLRIDNELNSQNNTLLFVNFTSNGTFINIDNKILKDSQNIYQRENRQAGRISFRRDCDGICLLEVNGRKILLVIEVKSGFNEIKNKGFEQLVASYVKIRSILQSIDGYNPEDYEEYGLLISYPQTGVKTVGFTSMIANKSAIVAPSSLDHLNNENYVKLSVDGEVSLDLLRYKVDSCHVNPALYNSQLHVKHIPATNLASSETINLDSYI